MPEVPITLLSRREVCRNAVFTVYFDHIRDAAGNEVTDYLSIVPHHRAADGVTGVAVLPVVDGSIVLLPTWRHAVERQGLELVKGFIDAGETAEQGALRELAEETGLGCDPAALDFVGHVAPEPSTLAGKGALFIARDCRPAASRQDDEAGLGRPERFSVTEVETLMRDGAIEDAMTLVACLRYLSGLR